MTKKNLRGSSKVVFTVTLVFLVCCFMATGSWAARKIDFYSANANSFIQKLNQNGNVAIGQVIGLSKGEALTLLRKFTDFNGVTHSRYQQTYKGIPVWGMRTIISREPTSKVIKLSGALALDIPNDIKGIPAALDAQGALREMQDLHKQRDITALWHFRNEEFGTYIYLHKGKAYLCYVVSFFADTDCGNPSQFIHFIDVKTGKILHSFDMLRYADGVGPGGNLKVGYYYYGTDYPPFCVSEASGICTMNCADVKTVDLNHGTSGTTPYSYTCYENTHEQINGAYCPLNDAQYFGQVVFDTYIDWYGVPVLPFQLTLRCHYSTNYENAFWDGSTMTFGDGYTTFYPLVSLDVVAHEVSHGFTQYNSDLNYYSQSGGINEAFSDMAGEACEYYMRGSCDYMCGYDIFKNPTGALRYLYDPPLDGISIDHVDDYYEGMDVHYSSGIFNKVFYLLGTTSGWNTRMAFDIFVAANQSYWAPTTNFQQGAEDALIAALNYGYPCQDVVNAFSVVGISLTCPGPPTADFVGSPTSGGYPLMVTFTDQSVGATSWSWDFGDTGTSNDKNPIHTYTSAGIYTVTLTATNASGSDIMVKPNYITVTSPQLPDADFTASSTDIVVGDSITFTDLSTENPTSWDWDFEGGTPDNSNVQNPSITYNTVGTYTVSLTATNLVGSDTETRVDYINVAEKPYCASSGSSQSYEYIAGVEVADLSNTSGPSPYSDFTYLSANLTQGASVNLSLTPGFTGSIYTEYWKIWIDYNHDHDFEDVNEEVFSGSGSTVLTGSFIIPTSTVIGDTRMRVSMSYSTYPPYCGTFTYGEVEDYTVTIGSGFNAEDLVVRTSDARLLMFPFENDIFVGSGKQVGHGWNFTHYLVGNWNTDYPTQDLIVRNSNTDLYLYPYRNETFYTYGSKKVGENFNYTHYFVGNWTNNGTDDLIVRDSNGYLWLIPFANDAFGTPINLGGGWNYTHYFVGNWSGNGTPDLIARDSAGNMWFFKFDNGAFAAAKKVGNGWNFANYFVGNWTGDGTDDLIVRDSSGNVRLYPFRYETFYISGSGKIVATGWNYADYFVGDWKDNNTDDMIVRNSSGNLTLYPFENETFGTGTTAGTNFNYTHYFVGQWTDQ